MNTDINIKNFRIFDYEGVEVPLRPITILTGCNNVGKSSVVKGLCLLKDFCQQLKNDLNDGRQIQLERYKLDFHKSPNNTMGGFDLVRHRKTNEKDINIQTTGNNQDDTKNNRVIFEVVVESYWLLQDVILHLEFGTLEWDDLNNGYLLEYSIKTIDGKTVYEAERGKGASMNLSIVKKSFLHFLYGQYVFSKWQNAINYRMATDCYPIEDNDEERRLFIETSKNILQELGANALVYLYEWQLYNCKLPWRDGCKAPAPSLMKGIQDSSVILNSPLLGVYCFFPCMLIFKEFKKNEIIQKIHTVLNSQEEMISILDRKIVDLFLSSFDASDSLSLHEFISKMEDKRFFVLSHFDNFGCKGFVYPNSFWTAEINDFPYDESKLPKTANWSIALSAIDIIDRALGQTSNSYVDFDEINMVLKYRSENFLDGYFRRIIEDIFANLIPGSLSYSSTMLLQPKRLYSLEENDDFAASLGKYFEVKRLYEENRNDSFGLLYNGHYKNDKYKPCSFINKWFQYLQLSDHIEIKSQANGYGVTVHLYENKDDEVGMQLIDKGLGITQLFVVLLKIENAILEIKTNEALYVPNFDGFNKDLIQYFRTYNQMNPITVALEEPECHLHPSLQAKFADILIDAYKQYGVHFIIESHSEYLIRKLQVLVSSEKVDNNLISLLYINPASRSEYLPLLTDIGIDKDGMLKNEFGTGFFDESLRLSRELFKSKTDDYED